MLISVLCFLFPMLCTLQAQTVDTSQDAILSGKCGKSPRILISTDIGGTDPYDNQSMLHLLMYSDKFDVEGLVSSPSFGQGSKEEILRMIDVYEKDFPLLRAHCEGLKTPGELREVCKQGRRGLAPLQGYDKPTEGSDWIVRCARRKDSRPLWVLVWGSLEDVAQALHDAPDIASRIRIYYIGGPNKKWGVNSYAYIAKNFPNLWMIENNASYRGLISDTKDDSHYHARYYDDCIKGEGNIGADFINYYKGVVKMGDTPSLLYMMNGDANNPEGESWGGSFEKTSRSSRRIVQLPTVNGTSANGLGKVSTDTVPVYSVVEFCFKGRKQDVPANTPCFTLLIDKQKWDGYYSGKGNYMVRYSPKQKAVLDYEISSTNGIVPSMKGTLVVDNTWPGKACKTDYKLGGNWWTDKADDNLFVGKWQGFATVEKHRQAVLDDWGKRLQWLKSK